MEHLQDNLRTYSPLEPLTDEEKGIPRRNGTINAEISYYPL